MGRYLWYQLSLTFHISRLKKVQPCKTSNKHTQCNFKLLKLNLLSPVVVRLYMGDTFHKLTPAGAQLSTNGVQKRFSQYECNRVNSIFANQAREYSGSVVEYSTQDQRAAGWSLTGVTVLSLSKTH